MTVRGRVKNGVIVLENGTPSLAEGTLVEVKPVKERAGNPSAIIAAMQAPPHVSLEDVDELQKAIAAGKQTSQAGVFSQPGVEPPSKERQDALLQLIGICKTEHPPGDDEVEHIFDEARMRKYG
jgi:hypothetical protein